MAISLRRGWISDARKLKAVEEENQRLKKLLAESSWMKLR
jgi:hypothetical protein